MKKRIFIFGLTIVLSFIMLGCSEKNESKTKDVSVQSAPEPVQTEDKSVISLYEEVLADTYEYLINFDSEKYPGYGFEGIWDAALALGDDALSHIGYAFMDLNGDDVNELLIGVFDKDKNAFTNNEIYTVYAITDGSPEVVLDGWSRNSYSLKEDGCFFHQGSSGAAYSEFGLYHISDDNELVCNEFYYTYPDDENPEIIKIFYNTTGVLFPEESEELDITIDEFWALEEDFSKGTLKLEATTFDKLDEDIVKKALEPKPDFDVSVLEGEWELVSGETDGYEYTAEEAGYTTGLTIDAAGAHYSHTLNDETKTFDAELKYQDIALYEGCGNDDWSVEFVMIESDFDAEEEYYATLTDDDTLLLQCFFPFDGAQGVSYETYKRK
ncbi:MAG: hypothetical protein II998_10285 [Clostridia bacterium]|nr:hypothetical protein [Clostridia bacterium]